MYRDIPEELRSLIEPVVDGAGLELVDVTLRRGRPPWLLRITVDTPEGDGRVLVDQCAVLSREIGTQLDVADAIDASYRLEVTSPGLDRVLARDVDFARAQGCEVAIETQRPVEGRRRFRGRLVAFDGEIVSVEVDGRAFRIPFAEVKGGNAIYAFSRADFTGGARR
jgi:ribosome maturation factor RimP